MLKRLAIATASFAALLLAAPVAQATGPTVPVTLGQKSGEAVFARGHPDHPDTAIIDHLRSLIDRAAPDSTILGTTFAMEPGGVIENALWEAYHNADRRVTVKLISDKPRSDTLSAAHAWPADNSSPRFKFKECASACMARENAATGGEVIMHSKFFLFNGVKKTPTTTQVPVSWVSSANLEPNTGTNAWNDAITWWNDPDMNWGLWTVWTDMWNGPYSSKMAWPNDSFDYFTWPYDNDKTIGNGVFQAPNSATFGLATPDLDADTWEHQLKLLTGAPPGAAPGSCQVVALHNKLKDERLDVADEFKRLAEDGCVVRLIVNRTHLDPTNDIDQGWKTLLCEQTNGDLEIDAVTKMHEKAVFAQATVQDKGFTQVVWAGSHNMSQPALRGNDELMTRVDGSLSLYNAYVQQYLAAWNARSDHICTA